MDKGIEIHCLSVSFSSNQLMRVSNANHASEWKIIYRAYFGQFFDNDQLYEAKNEGGRFSD
jgi:hypothetical protein